MGARDAHACRRRTGQSTRPRNGNMRTGRADAESRPSHAHAMLARLGTTLLVLRALRLRVSRRSSSARRRAISGWRRTAGSSRPGVWPLAFVAEFASTRVGVPFGLYHYTGITRGRELFIAERPVLRLAVVHVPGLRRLWLARLAAAGAAAPRSAVAAGHRRAHDVARRRHRPARGARRSLVPRPDLLLPRRRLRTSACRWLELRGLGDRRDRGRRRLALDRAAPRGRGAAVGSPASRGADGPGRRYTTPCSAFNLAVTAVDRRVARCSGAGVAVHLPRSRCSW